MKKITPFFLFCSGADTDLLKRCPTETSKYVGMGATIFFTGVFAALAAGYALYTVFDSVWIACLFGLLWGLMIFNLDRYIVSSMRKEGRFSRELLMASPRIILAILISIVIAKPLELKIFEKEINPELVVMEQEAYARQEAQLKARYIPEQDSLKAERQQLRQELSVKAQQRDELIRIAQEEADGTGGSRRRNLGPIYKAKKADADKAEAELQQLAQQYNERIKLIEQSLAANEAYMNRDLSGMDRGRLNGPAARIEALSRLTAESTAIWWADLFIMFLFIAIEISPVLVKLISSKGPFDNLLKIEEHHFHALEIEEVGKTNAETKGRVSTLPQHERSFVDERLDAALKRS
jgi:hypothetical protein